MIFGLLMTLLFNAIAQVESDRGVTSRNVYQLRDIYIDDINRIYNLKLSHAIKNRKKLSEMAMILYWMHYGGLYKKETGLPVTYEILARIHNGGPRGYKKNSTKKYWERVKAYLPTE